MTFRQFCEALEGKWVKVWTVDGVPADDGSAMAFAGRLRLHADFLELHQDDGEPGFAVRLAHIVALVESSVSILNQVEKMVGQWELERENPRV